MSSITRRPVPLVLAVVAVPSIQLVPQSAFYGDDYLQIGVLFFQNDIALLLSLTCPVLASRTCHIFSEGRRSYTPLAVLQSVLVDLLIPQDNDENLEVASESPQERLR